MYKDTYQQTPERIAFKKWLDETKPGWQGGKGNLWKELTKEHIETLWVAFLAGCRAGEGRKRGEMASDERKYSYDSYCEKLAEGFLVDEPKRTPDDVKELAQVYSYFFSRWFLCWG